MNDEELTRTPAYDRIILVQIKVERAKQHFLDLEKMLERTRYQYRDTKFRDFDSYTGTPTWYRAHLPIFHFEALAIAGDLIHNLRSALDHLAYQLVLAGSNEVPTRRVFFPISKSFTAYETDKSTKVEGMRPEAVELIDRLKPYKGGTEEFWEIHSLDNTDKHRNVFTIGDYGIYIADWWQGGEFLLKPRFFKANNPTFSQAHVDDVEEDVDFALNEAVSDSGVVKSDALLPTMQKLIDFVDSVIPQFEPHLG